MFVPDDGDGGRTMAELTDAEKDAISHRGRAARELRGMAAERADGARPHGLALARAAAVSIVSNTVLILLKVVAGAVTGSVAILTEAMHSRDRPDRLDRRLLLGPQGREPADASHRYGHEKFENVAAAVEGMLILVGSGVIVFAAIRRLIEGTELESLGFGIAVVASPPPSTSSSRTCLYRRARETDSPRWRATPRTCAPTPTRRSACSSASALVSITGDDVARPGRRAR